MYSYLYPELNSKKRYSPNLTAESKGCKVEILIDRIGKDITARKFLFLKSNKIV